MIVEERIVDYIRSLETRNNEILETIEQEALKSGFLSSERKCRAF